MLTVPEAMHVVLVVLVKINKGYRETPLQLLKSIKPFMIVRAVHEVWAVGLLAYLIAEALAGLDVSDLAVGVNAAVVSTFEQIATFIGRITGALFVIQLWFGFLAVWALAVHSVWRSLRKHAE